MGFIENNFYSFNIINVFRFVLPNSLIEVWESGLPSFWVKQNMPRAPKCFGKIKPETTRVQKVSIRLQDLKGAFLVLASGIGLAIFTFLVETIINYNKVSLHRLVPSMKRPAKEYVHYLQTHQLISVPVTCALDGTL